MSAWTTWLVDTKRGDPRRVYSVQGGMIRISGDGFGYLSTDRAYADYRLVVEVRWVTMPVVARRVDADYAKYPYDPQVARQTLTGGAIAWIDKDTT